MRNVIAISMSTGAARIRVARVLDAYLWRISEGTWRGRASSACLRRMSAELRRKASRNTAVAIHEVKSGAPYKEPILTIGRKDAFGPRGTVPVSQRAPKAPRPLPEGLQRARAALAVAAFFHDIGKAGVLFQRKLREAVAGQSGAIADKARHELISFAIWDRLFGGLIDDGLVAALAALTPEGIDRAWTDLRHQRDNWFTPRRGLGGRDSCLTQPGLARSIGLLILTHHRLPASRGPRDLLPDNHLHTKPDKDELTLAPGRPFWHDPASLARLRGAAEALTPGPLGMADMLLRTCLMTGDHYGSAIKEPATAPADHAANTLDGAFADDLGTHTTRVMRGADEAFLALIAGASLPALAPRDVPVALRAPSQAGLYGWQGRAAAAAAELGAGGGGFFACVIAGTGTGKTFGLPAILAAAVGADPDEDRRRLRFTLGLGLRTLAAQSARAYVQDVGFAARQVRVAVGSPPLEIPPAAPESPAAAEGSESLTAFDGLAAEEPPVTADDLSWSPEDDIPAFLHRIIRKRDAVELLRAPVVAGTIDQLMASVRPVRSFHLTASVRVMTADLVIDEIDQLGPEDLVAVHALIRQSAAAGRRVVIASATLPPDVARAAFDAYRAGWADHAALHGVAPHVCALVVGDQTGALSASADCADIAPLYADCAAAQVAAPRSRRIITDVIPIGRDWPGVVEAVSAACDRAHSANSVEGLSAGLVRVGRISGTIALAHGLAQRPSPTGARRAVVVLHSRMTQAARSLIENDLRQALTRKSAPLGGLRALLAHYRVADPKVQLIVVSSPVIETGNDLDFDYAVVDPTDSRSVIQTAGRVRRHRRDAAPGPNLLLLGMPLQIAAGDARLEHPGPEFKPHDDTRVPRRDLGPARGNVRELLGALADDADARHVILRCVGACPSADVEAALREDMVEGHVMSDDIDRLGVGRLDRRRFRRPGRPMAELKRDGSVWHVDARDDTPTVPLFRLESDVPVPDAILIKDPHAAALDAFARAGIDPPARAACVEVPIDPRGSSPSTNPAAFPDHPVYGVIIRSHDPRCPFGRV